MMVSIIIVNKFLCFKFTAVTLPNIDGNVIQLEVLKIVDQLRGTWPSRQAGY